MLRAGGGRCLPPVHFEAVCIAQRNPSFLLGLTNHLLASGESPTSQDSLCKWGSRGNPGTDYILRGTSWGAGTHRSPVCCLGELTSMPVSRGSAWAPHGSDSGKELCASWCILDREAGFSMRGVELAEHTWIIKNETPSYVAISVGSTPQSWLLGGLVGMGSSRWTMERSWVCPSWVWPNEFAVLCLLSLFPSADQHRGPRQHHRGCRSHEAGGAWGPMWLYGADHQAAHAGS